MRDYRCCRHWAGFRGTWRVQKKRGVYPGRESSAPQFRLAAASRCYCSSGLELSPPTDVARTGRPTACMRYVSWALWLFVFFWLEKTRLQGVN